MDIKVEYLEEAQKYIGLMPEKARRKMLYNISLVGMGVMDSRIFKKLSESGIWEFRAEFESNEYRLLSFGTKHGPPLWWPHTGSTRRHAKHPNKRLNMQRKSGMIIIKHDKDMEKMTHEEMLDKYVGKVGTPEREAFDEKVRTGAEEYRIGEAIKQTRKKIGFTQQQLGERMGVKRAEVSKIESGRSITYSTIMRVFKALGAESATLDLGQLGRVALW